MAGKGMHMRTRFRMGRAIEGWFQKEMLMSWYGTFLATMVSIPEACPIPLKRTEYTPEINHHMPLERSTTEKGWAFLKTFPLGTVIKTRVDKGIVKSELAPVLNVNRVVHEIHAIEERKHMRDTFSSRGFPK